MGTELSLFAVCIMILGVCSQDEGDKPSKGGGKGDWSGIENLAGVLYELRDIKKDEELVCNALKMTDHAKLKINLTQPFDYEQMLTFLVWSIKHDFKSGKPLKLSALEWKVEVVETIATIFKKGCESLHVPQSFINIIKSLFMIYINSVPTTNGDKGKSKDVWKSTMEMLKKCSNAEKPLDISDTDGPLITEVGITIGDHLESVPVEPQEEMADGLDSLDLVVDSFWHMFSFAFGTCYPFMTNKATESALLKHAFLKDFMDDLMFRWREGGSPPMLYGPIFGEIDLLQAIVNSRACVTAAYLDNQLDDRQLIRPLELSGHNDSFPEYNEGLGFSY